jgi:hypothetical protein
MATGGGWDEARFFDVPGNDKFIARRNASTMSRTGYERHAECFE